MFHSGNGEIIGFIRYWARLIEIITSQSQLKTTETFNYFPQQNNSFFLSACWTIIILSKTDKSCITYESRRDWKHKKYSYLNKNNFEMIIQVRNAFII